MNKMSMLLFAVGLATVGCQEKEEEGVDLDRIVHLIEEEEAAEWKAPADGGLISGHTSPEREGIENDERESLR